MQQRQNHHLDNLLLDEMANVKLSTDAKLAAIAKIEQMKDKNWKKYQALHSMVEHITESNKADGYDVSPPIEPLPNINARNAKGDTSLLVVVRLREAKVAEALIQTKADPMIKDGNSTSLLTIAAENGDTNTFDMLLSHQSITDQDFVSPMIAAIQTDNLPMVQHLLKKAGPRRYSPEDGANFLTWAVRAPTRTHTTHDIIDELLEFGFNPAIPHRGTNTPLMVAVIRNFQWAAERLIACAHDHYASSSQAKLVVAGEGSLETPDTKHSIHPYTMADNTTNKSAEIKQVAVVQPLDDSPGTEPAKLSTDEKIVAAKKAEFQKHYINLLNNEGKSALDYAMERKDYSMILLLLKHGAELNDLSLADLLKCMPSVRVDTSRSPEIHFRPGINDNQVESCRLIYNFLVEKKGIMDEQIPLITDEDRTLEFSLRGNGRERGLPPIRILLNFIHSDIKQPIQNQLPSLLSPLNNLMMSYSSMPLPEPPIKDMHYNYRSYNLQESNDTKKLCYLYNLCNTYLKHIQSGLRDYPNLSKTYSDLGKQKEIVIKKLLKILTTEESLEKKYKDFYETINEKRSLLSTSRATRMSNVVKGMSYLLTGGISLLFRPWRTTGEDFLDSVRNLQKTNIDVYHGVYY